MGKLLIAENVSFRKPGALCKRNGYAPLSTAIEGSASFISQGQAIAAFRGELLMADGTALYSYDEPRAAWANKGAFLSAYVIQRSVIRSTYAQTAQDSATHADGLLVSAWEDSQGGVRYAAIDTDTGVTLVADGAVSGTGSCPKVVALGQYVIIFYVVGANLYCAPISVTSPSVLGSPATVTTSLAASLAYDAQAIGDRVFVTWATSTGWAAEWIGSTLSASATVNVATTTPTSMAVFVDSDGQSIVVGWYNGTTVSAQVRDYSLQTVVMATTTIETVANVVSVTGCAFPGSTSSLVFFYGISAASPSNYQTRKATFKGHTTSTPAALMRSVAPAGKAFYYGGRIMAPLAFQSALQSTYFVVDATGNVVAKIYPGLGGGLPARSQLAQVNSLGGSKFQLALLTKDLLTTTGGAVSTLTGVSSITLDLFDPQRSYARAELGQGLHLGGGFVALYDGAGLVEHGFHLYPEGVTTANLDSDTGTTNVYGYCVCYEWTDNQGQIHRSAPSPVVQQQKASTVDGSHRVTVTIPTLRVTAKQSTRRKVQCVVYRTAANGAIYYQASSLSSPVYNDTTADTVTFTDSVTDATLIGNPQLYTTGEIENIEPGPISGMAIHQNRIVALDAMNPLQLWWSKPVVPGAPVEFSDLFVQNVDAFGGDITAIARMDAWLIAFKETAIFVTNEDGPPSSGTGFVFSSMQQVPTTVGCVNPRSVNLGADGITFQSAKGWHLLTRFLQVQNIADADQWKDSTPVASHTMPEIHETRFVLDDGQTLIHDDFSDQWGSFTETLAVDSIIWRNAQAYLRPDGVVRVETPGVYSDAGAPIRRRWRSAWIQMAGLSGFQRAKTITLLGDYLGAHTLTCSIAYDFEQSPSQVITIDASQLEQPVYGGDSVYGGSAAPADSLVYGGAFPAYAWRLNLNRQKCTALQITIEEDQATPNEACSWTSITAVVGVKPGTRRLPAARQGS